MPQKGLRAHLDHFWDMASVSRIQPVSCNLRIALEMAAQPTALHFCKLLGVKLYQRVDLEPIQTISGTWWSSAVFNWHCTIYVLWQKSPSNLPYCIFASYRVRKVKWHLIRSKIVRFLAIRDNIHFLSHVVDMCTYETTKGLSRIQIGISRCRIDGNAPFGNCA